MITTSGAPKGGVVQQSAVTSQPQKLIIMSSRAPATATQVSYVAVVHSVAKKNFFCLFNLKKKKKFLKKTFLKKNGFQCFF